MIITAQNSLVNFFSICDQICWKLRTWSHLLYKTLMETFFVCAVTLLWLTYSIPIFPDIAMISGILQQMPKKALESTGKTMTLLQNALIDV